MYKKIIRLALLSMISMNVYAAEEALTPQEIHARRLAEIPKMNQQEALALYNDIQKELKELSQAETGVTKFLDNMQEKVREIDAKLDATYNAKMEIAAGAIKTMGEAIDLRYNVERFLLEEGRALTEADRKEREAIVVQLDGNIASLQVTLELAKVKSIEEISSWNEDRGDLTKNRDTLRKYKHGKYALMSLLYTQLDAVRERRMGLLQAQYSVVSDSADRKDGK